MEIKTLEINYISVDGKRHREYVVNNDILVSKNSNKDMLEQVKEYALLNGFEMSLLLLRDEKTKLLKEEYEKSQNVIVTINGNTMKFPLKGDIWNITIHKQYNDSQKFGSADLIWEDLEGNRIEMQDISVEVWDIFYSQARQISISNFRLKSSTEFLINNCEDPEELEQIPVDIFPKIQTLNI